MKSYSFIMCILIFFRLNYVPGSSPRSETSCMFLFWGNRLWWTASSSRAARVGQEAELEWKVSGVRQMPVQWTVVRKCACPCMVLLGITVAGRAALWWSQIHQLYFLTLDYDLLKEMKTHPHTCSVPAGDPPTPSPCVAAECLMNHKTH